MSASPPTRTEAVYDALRADLLNGVLAPGQKLRMVELGSRFGVSQSVVREVVTRLAEQGLAVATPQRGFRVRDLSVDDINDLTEARVQIESVVLGLAIERGDMGWETGVLGAHHVLDRASLTKDDLTVNEEWSTHHREFHRALLAGCGNGRLEGIAQSLRDSAELYRRWNWVLTERDQRDIAAEHRQLKELVLARDVEGATALLTEHIEYAPRQLVAYAHEHGVENLHR